MDGVQRNVLPANDIDSISEYIVERLSDEIQNADIYFFSGLIFLLCLSIFAVHASVDVRHVHFRIKEEFVGLVMNHAKHVPELDKIHALHALQLICMLLIWPFVCKSVQMAIMKVS